MLVANGYNGFYLSSAEMFNPISGAWIVVSPMGVSRTNHTATLLGNGKVFVTGGVNSTTTTWTTEVYTP